MYVKCYQCQQLYDSKHPVCPYDQCGRIEPRIFWTKADYDKERMLKDQDKGLRQ